MAIAKATSAQQQELLRQLNILGKGLYAILTQPQNVDQTGAAFDTKLTALEDAVDKVKAAR
uniref:Tail fiber protein n=1 Tax=Klebsiella phage vB_Kpn_HF0522 TaxID=3158833 RepID=A0AAU7PG60_9CAUD